MQWNRHFPEAELDITTGFSQGCRADHDMLQLVPVELALPKSSMEKPRLFTDDIAVSAPRG
jgi:hypothetical protein